jgi:hypothetical protein
LWVQQQSGPCTPATSYRLRVPLQGIGIMLQFLVNGASEGLRVGKAMVVSDADWAWLDAPRCQRGGFHCYFHPISSCQYSSQPLQVRRLPSRSALGRADVWDGRRAR